MKQTGGITLDQRYQRFLRTYPDQCLLSRGSRSRSALHYHDCGLGPDVLLLLPGLFSRADSWFPLIEGLTDSLRFLPVTYLSCASLDDLCQLMSMLLRRIEAERIHLLGHSFGGMLAGHLIGRLPDQFASLILAHSAPVPRELYLRIKILRFLIRHCPDSWWRRLARKWIAPERDQAFEDPFWGRYRELRRLEIDRAEVCNHADLFLGLCRPASSGAGEVSWSGPVLIIESDDDPTFAPSQRDRLKQEYPNKEVVTFSSAGHASLTHRTGAFQQHVLEFVKGVQEEAGEFRER